MILVAGGLGVIGSHVTRALLDLGETCLVVQRGTATPPDSFADEAGRRLVVEQVDVADRAAFLEIGNRHKITGIVNLVGVFGLSAHEPVTDARLAMRTLFNVLEAANHWEVARVGFASTIGVYLGALTEGPLREDAPLPMTTGHGIPAFKKIGELLTDYLADATGIEVLNYRIAAAWGPLSRRASPFIAAPELVHAAVNGAIPDLSALRSPAYADDGLDLVYVKDCGRAIALLHLADKLSYRTYNVATGRPTTNREFVDALTKVVPTAQAELPDGRDPNGPGHDIYLDIGRLRQDTGYQPAYDTERAIADYVDWLRAGNPR